MHEKTVDIICIADVSLPLCDRCIIPLSLCSRSENRKSKKKKHKHKKRLVYFVL